MSQAPRSIPGPLIVSLLAVAVGVFVLADELSGIVGSVLAPEPVAAGRNLDDSLARADELRDLSTRRFAGRSLFQLPSPPVRAVPAPPPVRETAPPPPPPTPPTPVEYAGPKPVGLLGNKVLFGDGLTISVGETRDGITVLGVNPDGTLRLGHGGGEYDYDLWPKSNLDRPVESGRGVPGLAAAPRPVTSENASPLTSPAVEPAATPTEPLTKEQVDKMSRREAQLALASIVRARNSNPDADTKKRLDEEYAMLVERIREAE